MAVVREIRTAGGALVRVCDDAYKGVEAAEADRRRKAAGETIDRIWANRARELGARLDAGTLNVEDRSLLLTLGARQVGGDWIFPEKPVFCGQRCGGHGADEGG